MRVRSLRLALPSSHFKIVDMLRRKKKSTSQQCISNRIIKISDSYVKNKVDSLIKSELRFVSIEHFNGQM